MKDLTVEEVAAIKEKYDQILREDYHAVQKAVEDDFQDHRKRKGKKHIRFVIPRDGIKSFDSILKKIKRKREEGNPAYNFEDIEDLIGVKLICPYPSDTAEVIKWMKQNPSFRVAPHVVFTCRALGTECSYLKRGQTFEEVFRDAIEHTKHLHSIHSIPSDKVKEAVKDEARVDHPRGYKGYHYTITVAGDYVRKFPTWEDKKCEVQIKSILEEAWDAKTHEVSYKKEETIKKELIDHVRLLSNALQVVDQESEVLKLQIEEEGERDKIRRRAAAIVYLKRRPVLKLAEELGYTEADLEQKERLLDIATRVDQRARERGVNVELCKLAALLAVMHDDEGMEVRALSYTARVIKEDPASPRNHNGRGTIYWALGRLPEALKFTEEAIKLAEEGKAAGPLLAAKSNFAYYVGYMSWMDEDFKKKARENGYLEKALEYLREISKEAHNEDTEGFLKIAFGESFDEVEQGRKLIKGAHEKAGWVLMCRDMGTGCDHVVRGQTIEEVIQKAREHATKVHPPEQLSLDAVKPLIQNEKEIAETFYFLHENVALKKLLAILNKQRGQG